MGKPIPMSEMCEKCIHEKVCCLMGVYKQFHKDIQTIAGRSENQHFEASVVCEHYEYRRESEK